MVNSRTALPENWAEMTPGEKRQWRLDKFLKAENIPFENPEAKAAYQLRAKRIVDAYNLVEPDRVPVNLPVGNLPYILYGINTHTIMYDIEKAVEACNQFNEKYSETLEYYAAPMATPAKILDILDYKLYTWPGHGLSEDAIGFQFVEGEYMKPEEYDALIRDPSDFWLRTYLPRIFGAFESFRVIQPLTNIIEMPTGQLMALGNPQIKETLKRMLAASEELERRAKLTASYAGRGTAKGYPARLSGIAKAPFDIIGDTLRGTTEIMNDMFRRPDKILEAVDKIADVTIHNILTSANFSRIYGVVFPLHKGADGWMSDKQFTTFYWPTLKKVMDALINEGLIVTLFAEGSYNTRLKYVNEFPKGSVCWLFDQTDMLRAKEILGDKCCIQGNIPASLISTGDPAEVKAYCRELIEGCGKGGGYILSAGCTADKPKLESMIAIMEAVREYGVYRH